MRPFLVRSVPLALIVTVLCALIYLAVQQDLRMSANDPQIQMAEDAAMKIGSGATVQSVIPPDDVEISQSLSPYIVIFDDTGKPIAGNGLLHGTLPSIPSGIFDVVRTQGEDRFTWQPEPGVRSAAIVTRVNGTHPGFVLAGRSLREVENRESILTAQVLGAWVVCLAVAFGAAVL
ncbi:MAG TPA: hypothetical protein VHA78_06065 [Candidatus Peribacteraceae bacterium]|nr:hypothetical protein [Candidatus Peribacteraceae bacterium]